VLHTFDDDASSRRAPGDEGVGGAPARLSAFPRAGGAGAGAGAARRSASAACATFAASTASTTTSARTSQLHARAVRAQHAPSRLTAHARSLVPLVRRNTTSSARGGDGTGSSVHAVQTAPSASALVRRRARAALGAGSTCARTAAAVPAGGERRDAGEARARGSVEGEGRVRDMVRGACSGVELQRAEETRFDSAVAEARCLCAPCS
jgi:hypothetical protein